VYTEDLSLVEKGGVCQLGKIACPKSPFSVNLMRIAEDLPTFRHKSLVERSRRYSVTFRPHRSSHGL
jgi:hypothetical protein